MTDVVELIKDQHRRMEGLLEQAEKADPEQMHGLLQQVADLLVPHSEAEESFVYPAIRRHDQSEAEEVKDGTAEHHHIEGLLQELLAEDASSPGYDGKLAAMIGELRHHVDEEEQDLLPVLSEEAGDAEREELGRRFAEATGHDRKVHGRTGSGHAQGRGDARGGDEGRTREELYQAARARDIAGRSTMSKEELSRALDADS
jgi:hemerythrin superfamily protein